MASELKVVALCALGALAAGAALSWALAVRRARPGLLALAVCLLLALNIPPVSSLFGVVHFAIAGMPLVLLVTAPRFAAVNREYGDAARSIGASEPRILLRLVLPLAWRPILLAAVLAFLRALAGLRI